MSRVALKRVSGDPGMGQDLPARPVEALAPEGSRATGLRRAAKQEACWGRDQIRTRAFRKWFGKSQVVDANGDPLVVYHGTVRTMTAFDASKADPENNLGCGFYFSSSLRDVEANYLGDGKDLKSKLDRMAEWLGDQQDLDQASPRVRREAMARLGVEHLGAVMPVYLSIQNPLRIGGDRETVLTYNPWGEFEEGEDGDMEWHGAVPGDSTLLAFLDHLASIASNHGLDIDTTREQLNSEAGEGGGEIRASRIIEIIEENQELIDSHDDSGNMLKSELIRQAFEAIGFDGVIDMSVYWKFGEGMGRGAGLPGMDEGVVHYIVFSPTQVKSATGNCGTFSPENPDLRG